MQIGNEIIYCLDSFNYCYYLLFVVVFIFVQNGLYIVIYWLMDIVQMIRVEDRMVNDVRKDV